MTYYALIEPIKYNQRYYVAKKGKGTLKQVYSHLDINVGKVYETEDQVLAKFLKEKTLEEVYSTGKESELKAHDIPYTIKTCRSCGGRVKKIVYHPVEVWES